MQCHPSDLQIKVELMDDPCLWRWAILDPSCNEVVADSWSRDWTAYASRDEAFREGRARLSLLRPAA